MYLFELKIGKVNLEEPLHDINKRACFMKCHVNSLSVSAHGNCCSGHNHLTAVLRGRVWRGRACLPWRSPGSSLHGTPPLPAVVPGEAVSDGPRAWAPATPWKTRRKFLAPALPTLPVLAAAGIWGVSYQLEDLSVMPYLSNTRTDFTILYCLIA